MDYSQSHVVTFNEYFKILRQKAMEKEATNQIKDNKQKEKEVRKVFKEWQILRLWLSAQFKGTLKSNIKQNLNSMVSYNLKEYGEQLHHNIQTSLTT
jgi:hypothetical protein